MLFMFYQKRSPFRQEHKSAVDADMLPDAVCSSKYRHPECKSYFPLYIHSLTIPMNRLCFHDTARFYMCQENSQRYVSAQMLLQYSRLHHLHIFMASRISGQPPAYSLSFTHTEIFSSHTSLQHNFIEYNICLKKRDTARVSL